MTVEETAAAYTATVAKSVRRSLFNRLKGLNLTQDEIARMVPSTARAAVQLSAVQDLAIITAAAGPLRAALEVANPGDPALADFDTMRDQVGEVVRELLDPPA